MVAILGAPWAVKEYAKLGKLPLAKLLNLVSFRLSKDTPELAA